jgi:hypothetical protein
MKYADRNDKHIIATFTEKMYWPLIFPKHPTPFQVSDAVSLKMRVEETNEETKEERRVWKEPRAVCLTSKIKILPRHVYFCNMKTEVSTFVAAVRQCFIYGKFGHISKFCAKEKQCFSCGEANHEGSCVEATEGTLNLIKGISPFSKC